MLKPGQKLFEYDIIRRLAQGGFGVVFEARDRLLNRQVAIKQLLLNRVHDEKAIKRFVQEARVIAALEHPNVVTVHALRLEDKNFYMIMEYLPGGSLRDLLDRLGKLPLEQAVNLTIGICEGLAQLHARGIIHRDIKAENILLTQDGRPKIIDFGIAHVPEAAGGMELTEAGFQPSTLLYSSPEQVRGEPLDARSDVYQVGELLYYMLAGQHYIDIDALETEAMNSGASNAFRLQSKLFELLESAICNKMPEGLKLLWREVGSLAGVVEKALAKNRLDRFADAVEFAATLRTLSINTIPASVETEKRAIQDSRAYNKRGLAHASTRNFEQAIVDFSKALQLDPQYAEAYNNRSTAHLMMGNYGQAVLDCTQALELAPDFVATYVNRGIAYTGLRDYKRAIEDCEKALQLDPDNVYACFNLGNTYLWRSEYQKSIPYYDQAIRTNPEFVAAYVNRGIAHNELKQFDAALQDYSQAIQLNPDYVHAYYNRANLHREAGRHELAVADYSKVIALNPEHRYAHENRGDAYAALGEEDKASDDYTSLITQASSIHPKRLSVARSMLMPATPLDFLKR